MTFTGLPGGASQGHAVIKGTIIANLGGFPYYNPHAVVDEEAPTYGCARVYFHPGKPTGKGGQTARQKTPIGLPQLMTDTVQPNGLHTRVIEQYFQRTARRRIPMVNGPYVLFQSGYHTHLDSSDYSSLLSTFFSTDVRIPRSMFISCVSILARVNRRRSLIITCPG